MSKQNKLSKRKNTQYFKPIILILISIILYALPQILAPTYQIGILPVDNISQKELITINSNFQTENKYFNSIILNETLNSSYIEKENGFLLNDDFFKYKNITQIKQKYNLDFLIITTDKQIKDFNKGGFGIWGQADTVTETVLMTTIYFGNDKEILPSIAQHEIYHLFGYLHNPIEQNGIMQYKDNIGTQKLSNYYNLQLPLRATIKQFITNKSFSINYFLINLILVLALYPLFLGLNQILQILLKIKEKTNQKNKSINKNKIILHSSTTLGLFILFCINFGFLVLFASLFLSLSSNYFLLNQNIGIYSKSRSHK